MLIHGWGRYPRAEAEVLQGRGFQACHDALREPGPLIARGAGRSYGDSSLAARVIDMQPLDHLLAFDPSSGLLRCAAGATLADILETLVPRGWFLPCVPGTRFVTVGGAIASDVHGKNHHWAGSFSAHVREIELLLGNGERVTASREAHPALFEATCGGMGLTGIILSATLHLIAIRSSHVVETTLRADCLEAVMEGFATHGSATYSVAWIDALQRGPSLGRSLLMLGEHAATGPLAAASRPPLPIPVDMPAGLLNPLSVRLFNALYYRRTGRATHTRSLPFEPFFFPLDGLAHWNRLYGRRGFVQYQMVLPREAALSGLRQILQRIAQSGLGSPLSVLKAFGPGNDSPLSFPREGYTLALDFQAKPATFRLLDELDRIVLEHEGRLYLTKDARMQPAVFKAMYPRWETFEEIRARYHAHGKFASLQSRRLGLQ